ncbi:Integral membrane protein SYS1-related [Kalmanozyma brasiliensis GHG001]|uniref:Integral membrane protein n=1 Tax=Kalmanozyma brasiliensis (strain GHG001) TaxID=1365824 RepID=V5EPX1_KALBG|nr:Integral membrane protein SYS1-related [Kalmanozyma brasiliensis GHG001]EST07150.1 Integral membrane protein SYS1-related [Kalmanozyma brasiliensis GHG001]
MKEAFSMPLQGWDALRIVLQIISLQTIHYLLLATLLPPFLAIFADTSSLMFEGGPTQVGMVFDWRQIAGRPTYDWSAPASSGESGWTDDGIPSDIPEVTIDPAVLVEWNLDNVWLDKPLIPTSTNAQDRVLDHDHVLRFKHFKNGTVVPTPDDDAAGGRNVEEALEHWEWDHTRDTSRSWTLILAWLLTIPPDIFTLVYLVRRPTHMLDHALTFHLVNLVVCTWYVGRLPRGLKWWLTMMVHAGVMVVWSEQLAIKREMGRGVGYSLVGNGTDEETGRRKVVFDAEEAERYELRPL